MARGYIFLCNNETEKECFKRRLFGGPATYQGTTVKPGDFLFLYNFQSKRMYGLFTATSEARLNIIPTAWDGNFPLQVKIEYSEKYNPITKTDFGQLIRFSNGKHPDAILNESQVLNLIQLFQSEIRLPAQEHDFRDKFPASIFTNDGHFVRSAAELAIDNWLYDQEIAHGYERKVPIEENMFCDFVIPIPGQKKKVYLEYWGLEDEKYKKRKKDKQDLYHKYDLPLIELNTDDINNLDDVLPTKLRPYLPDKIFS